MTMAATSARANALRATPTAAAKPAAKAPLATPYRPPAKPDTYLPS
ncbi:MAG: hypothetical protein QXG44_15795 [Candidatus Jordarchaeaceae archaeon]